MSILKHKKIRFTLDSSSVSGQDESFVHDYSLNGTYIIKGWNVVNTSETSKFVSIWTVASDGTRGSIIDSLQVPASGSIFLEPKDGIYESDSGLTFKGSDSWDPEDTFSGTDTLICTFFI